MDHNDLAWTAFRASLLSPLLHHGGDPKIFDDVVKDQIHEFTGGNPRGINNAAVACLLQATSKRSMRIDEETFRQASIELHWN